MSCHKQILLHHLSAVYEIQELVVENQYKGQQIGTKLLALLEKMLLDKNQNPSMLLEVAANKKRIQSHDFYRKNGFSDTHFKFTKLIC